MPRTITAVIMSSVFIGCIGDLPSQQAAPGADASARATMTDLDRELMQIAMGYKSFAKVSSQAYPSTLGTFDINVYVTGDVSGYASIHPETSGTGVKLRAGTVIVREVLDASGATSKLTVLAKGPMGYDGRIGDWWWGVVDPTGTPVAQGNALQIGRVESCHGCHIPRATDDYMFGVPKIYESSHP